MNEISREFDLMEINETLTDSMKNQLVIPPLLLDYGTYRFQLNASMDNETGIYSVNHSDINIVKTPLVGKFADTTFRYS